MNKLTLYLKLMRFDKPIGILLLLWPTLWALWIAADGRPPLKILIIFILGTVLMRAAGCVINDIADRDFDKHVKRTADRPLTAGLVSLEEAQVFFGILIVLAFVLVLFLNALTIKLAFVGALLSIVYPFTKRFMHFPQFFLGLTFAWSIPLAFAAVLNTIPPVAFLLFGITVLWAMIYDTEYAMVDHDDDLKLGIKSTAVFFGDSAYLWLAVMQVLFVLLLVFLGIMTEQARIYYVSCAITLLAFVYQQFLIHEHDRDAYFKAFLNNHWIGLIVFLGL